MSGQAKIYRVALHESSTGVVSVSAAEIEAEYKHVTVRVHDSMARSRVMREDLMKIKNESIGERYVFTGWAPTKEQAAELAGEMLAMARRLLDERRERIEKISGQLDRLKITFHDLPGEMPKNLKL